jgi:hypothetical protein
MMVQGKFHPWMGLTLAILAAAAVLVLFLREPIVERRSTPLTVPPNTETAPATPATAATAARPQPPVDSYAAEAGDFRLHMRRTLLAGLKWLTSPAARELYLVGHPREAVDRNLIDLNAQATNGDRDAAAALYYLIGLCKDPEAAAAMAGSAQTHPNFAAEARKHGEQLAGAARAKALAFVPLFDEKQAALDQRCRNLDRVDAAAIEQSVRNAASDGHVPSLASLGQLAAHTPAEPAGERYLLSASLLGDPASQWWLAQIYMNRKSKSDRGKMRFWLEQAADKEPEAAFALGHCLLKECDGQPANPERGQRLIEAAAASGSYSALGYLTGHSEGSSDSAASVDPATAYAWREFRGRLADEGCNENYLWLLLNDDEERRAQQRDSLLPGDRSSGERQADELYKRNAATARKASGCE